MYEELLKKLAPVFRGAPKRPPVADVKASLVDIRRASASHRRSYERMARPGDPRGRALTRRFEAYLDGMDAFRDKLAQAIRVLYTTGSPFLQRIKRAKRLISSVLLANYRLREAMKKELCRYLKNHGVREQDARFRSCPKGARWLMAAVEIEKSACSCTDVACARAQQKALNNFIKHTKGATVTDAL